MILSSRNQPIALVSCTEANRTAVRGPVPGPAIGHLEDVTDARCGRDAPRSWPDPHEGVLGSGVEKQSESAAPGAGGQDPPSAGAWRRAEGLHRLTMAGAS